MGKKILAAIVGVIIGGLTVFAIESINMVRFPWPEGLTLEDKEGFNAYVAGLPISALLTVIFAHAAGSFIAGFISAKIALSNQFLVGFISGLLLLAGGIFNLTLIEHPTWFMVIDVLVFIPLALLGARVAAKEAVSEVT